MKGDERKIKDSRSVVINSERGYELGMLGGALSHEQQEKYKNETSKFENVAVAMLQDVKFVKIADDIDLEAYYRCRAAEEEDLKTARKILEEHKLGMKLVDVEYMLDRKKFYFYFTASQRVDFRLYVRDLAHTFRTRIEMRQVGSRDEAKITSGLSTCGRPCCCSYWLRGFSPISIRIVKEQRSALNPTKISGLCGRLKCCMSYEKDYYSEVWSKLPGPGAKIKTEQGFYILESLYLGNERVNIRFPNGRLVPVAIKDFPDFQETVLKGEEWGEDKELLEKKKASAARVAARKEKSTLRKAARPAGLKANAMSFRPNLNLTENSGNQNEKEKENKDKAKLKEYVKFREREKQNRKNKPAQAKQSQASQQTQAKNKKHYKKTIRN
ncbi:MAG: hypothetical protein IJ597_00295 [Synergistaceae bacterium]|nr:hypothetical protein [Synergistaceae bacterium]